MTNKNEEVIATFSWPSSWTPNCQCQVSVRKGKSGTRNVYIDTLHADTGKVVKGIYFRPDEIDDILQALQAAKERL